MQSTSLYIFFMPTIDYLTHFLSQNIYLIDYSTRYIIPLNVCTCLKCVLLSLSTFLYIAWLRVPLLLSSCIVPPGVTTQLLASDGTAQLRNAAHVKTQWRKQKSVKWATKVLPSFCLLQSCLHGISRWW